MLENKIITGIMSYGMSGKIFHAPFIDLHEGFQLYAVLERHTKKAQQDYPDIISYASAEELLADPKIELVVVNTPNDTHVDYALKALQAGKHVLLEKPFAPSKTEAELLFNTAQKYNRHIFAYQNRRFDADFLALKKVVESQAVGQPIELHLRFDRFRPTIGPKTFKETPRPAAGVFYDLGAHLLDQVISLFGRPEKVNKVTGTYREASQVDDYANVHMYYPKGLNVFVTTSLLVARAEPAIVLHGSKGSFIKSRSDRQEAQLQAGMKPSDPNYGLEESGSAEAELVQMDSEGALISVKVPAERGDYMEVYRSLYGALRENKSYFVHPDEIKWQLEILELDR